ncbi:MAG TPA: protein kinase [Trebonia sp.]|nr:protein kinase [Trebonia sp.]
MAGEPSGRGRRLLDALVPGARVGGYRLEGPVGAGGMAAVYRAHDEQLDRMVALKLVYAGPGIDEVIRQRFVREALNVAKVDDPHIIPVYAAGQADDMLWIAMRYVSGGDLRRIIDREGPLPPARAAAFISQVASALDTAHEEDIVHRDVKPANILVDVGHGKRPDHAYLSDFGLARGVLSVGGLTQDGQFVGTPDYASPEQIKGHLTDGQADQYSLAAVAYTLLTGLVPYVRDSPMAVLYAQLDEPPPRVSDVRSGLPRDVDWVLVKAMAKRSGRRYASCGEFADALRDALGLGPYDPTGPVRQRPAPATTAPWPLSRPGFESTITAEDPPVPERPVADRPVPERPVPERPMPERPAPTARQTVPLAVPPDEAEPVAQPSPTSSPGPGPGAARSSVHVPVQGRADAARAWAAVVSADHDYYDSVQAANEQDAARFSFPDDYAHRRIELAKQEMTIGRRSRSRHIEPDIDLTGDPGVSRLHAILTTGPDGTCTVTDKDTPNGTQVNGREIPANEAVTLRSGDYINLGVWTRITLTRA